MAFHSGLPRAKSVALERSEALHAGAWNACVAGMGWFVAWPSSADWQTHRPTSGARNRMNILIEKTDIEKRD